MDDPNNPRGFDVNQPGSARETFTGLIQGATTDLAGGLVDLIPYAQYLLSPTAASIMPDAADEVVAKYGSEALGDYFFGQAPTEDLQRIRDDARLVGGVVGLGEALTMKAANFTGRALSKVFRDTDGAIVGVTPEGVPMVLPDEAVDLPDASVMQMADEGGDAPVQGDLFDRPRIDPDDPRVLPTDLDAFLTASAQRRQKEADELQAAFREGYKPGPRRTNTPLTVSELNMLRAMRAGKGGARGLLHGIRGAKSNLYIDEQMVENFLNPGYRPYPSSTDPTRLDTFPEEVSLYGGPFDLQGFQPNPAKEVTVKDLILAGGLGQRSRKILAIEETAASAEGQRPGFSTSRDPYISVRGFTDQGDATDTFNVSSLEDTVIVIPSVQLRREDFFGNRLARDDVESFSAGDILESDLENLSPSQYLLKAYDPDKSIQLKPNTEFKEDELHLGSGQGFATPVGSIVRNLTAREKEDLVRYSNRIAIQRNNLGRIKSVNFEDSAFTNITGPDRMNYNTLGFGNPDLVTKGMKELEEEIVILGTMEAESPLVLNLTNDRFIAALGPKILKGLESPEFRAAWTAKHGNEGLSALEELGRKASVLDPKNRESRPSISIRRKALEDAAEIFHADLIYQEINDKLKLVDRFGFAIKFEHGGEGKYERTLNLIPMGARFVKDADGKRGVLKFNQGFDLQEALIEALRTNSDGLYGEAARRLTPENRDLGVLILDGIRRVEKRYVTEVDKLPEAQSFNAIYRNNKYLLQNAIEIAGKAFPATGTDRIKLDPELKGALAALKRSRRGDPEGPKSYARNIIKTREARMRPAGAQLYAEGGIVSMIPDVVQNYHGGGGVHVHPNIRTGRVSDFRTGDEIIPQMYEYDFYTPAEMRDGSRVPSPIEMQTGVRIDDFKFAFPDVPVDEDADGVVDYMVPGRSAVLPKYQGDNFIGRIPLTADQQAVIDMKRAQFLGDVEYIADMMALEGDETYGLMASAFDMDPQRKEEALRNLGVASMIPQLLAEEQVLFTQMPAVLGTETAQTFPTDAYGTYYSGVDKIIMDTQNISQSIDRGMPFQSQLTNMHELMHAGLQKRVADMIARRPEYFQNLRTEFGLGGYKADTPRFKQVTDVDGMYAMMNIPLENRQLFDEIYNEYITARVNYRQSGEPADLELQEQLKLKVEDARAALLEPYLTSPYGGEAEYSLGHSLIAVPTVTEFLPKVLNRGTLVDQAFGSSLLRDYAERYLPRAHFADVQRVAADAGLLEKYPMMKHLFKYKHFAGVIPEGKTYGEPGVRIIFPEGFEAIDGRYQSHAGRILTQVFYGNLDPSNKDMSTINRHAGSENLAPFVQQIRDFNVEFIDFVLDKHRSLTSRYRADIIEPGMSGAAITPEDVVIQDLFLENQAEQAASERMVAELTGN